MTKSTGKAMFPNKVKLKLSFALIFCILLAFSRISVFADSDGYELQVKFSYTEVDAVGETLRDTYDLIRDGVFPGESGDFDYGIVVDVTIVKPNASREAYNLGGYANNSDRTVYDLTAYDMNPQTGGYSVYSCTIPDGYTLAAAPDGFSLSQQEVDSIKSGGVVTKYINIEIIKKTGTLTPAPTSAPSIAAKPTASSVLVNGNQVAFDAYNINGNNYFKLRDLAYTLSETKKRFGVGWDGTNNAISLTSGQTYTPVGGEMIGKGVGNKAAIPTKSIIYLDGKEIDFTAYNIDGNNYFKLRDIGQAFDFGVDWDGAKNTIVIDTSKGYTPEVSSTSATPAPASTSTDGPATFSNQRETEYTLDDYEWSCGFSVNVRFGPVTERPTSLNYGFTYWGEDGKRTNTSTATGEGWRDDPPYYELGFHANIYQAIKGSMPPTSTLVDGKTYHWVAYVELDGKRYESSARSFTFKLPAKLPNMQTKPADASIKFENMTTTWREDQGFVAWSIGYVFSLEYEFYGGWNYSEVGIQCWDSNGKELDYAKYGVFPKKRWEGTDSSGLANPFSCRLCSVDSDGEMTGALVPGQTYTWIAYVISDGKRYESEKQTFVFTTDGAWDSR